jgi:serine/threonine protein kinase
MNPQSSCPSKDQLRAYERGELDGKALDVICEHLATCTACESVVASLDGAGSGIVANLRRFVDHEPWVAPDEIASLEAKVKAIPLKPSEAGEVPTSAEVKAGATPAGVVGLSQVGKYRLLEEIGHGGMGCVYKALHTKLNKQFAVKIILPEYAGSARMRARFKREMAAVGALSHPNIVAATDADDAEGHNYLAMEFVDGLNLDSLLRRCGPLPVAEACEIIRQAALGLQYIHENRLVHRDLKPSNMMLSTDGIVKILDLGLARLFTEDSQSDAATRSHLVMGTEDYMAPEQWEDSHDVDIRADIYSLGCTFYKLLAGEAPFSGPEYKSARKKRQAHEEAPCPLIQNRRSDVRAEVLTVLNHMLEKDRTARFGTPLEVAEALAPLAEGTDCRPLVTAALQQSTRSPQALPGITTQAPKQQASDYLCWSASGSRLVMSLLGKRWYLVAGASALVAVLVGALVSGWIGRPEPPQFPQVPPPETVAASPGGLAPLPDDVAPPIPRIQPGILCHLLQQSPVELFKKKPGHQSLVSFSKERMEVGVSSGTISMLSLGKITTDSYRIDLAINQPTWRGGVGIFFGWHFEPNGPKPRFKVQWLEVKLDQHVKEGLLLTRQWAYVYDVQGELMMLDIHNLDASSQKLEQPAWGTPNTEPSFLTVEVTQNFLDKVIWNRQRLLRLTDPAKLLESGLNVSDFAGEFGTFVRSNFGVFGKATVFSWSSKQGEQE